MPKEVSSYKKKESAPKQAAPFSSTTIPPQSLDMERALLGALLLRPEAIHDIADIVRPDSFYAEKHRIIYQGMLTLSDRHEPIDIVSLGERLRTDGSLDRVGGRSYLGELTTAAASPGNISHYADVVSKKQIMRELIEASYRIAEAAFDETRDSLEVLDGAEKDIYQIGNRAATHKFVAMGDILPETWESIANRGKDGMRGVSTGFKDMDTLLSGLQPSDLVILAARPSMGKTSLALDIARHAAVQNNVPVGIFSLEMSSGQLVERMLAAESYVNAWKLRTGTVSAEEELSRLRDAMESLSKAPIFIDDKPANNILAMRAVARRLKRERGIGLIVVDYLQLMAPTYTKQGDSMVQQVTEISRSLKALAREIDVPVLALSQLSRAVEQRGGKPRLSDLRDSGSIEQDADVVMFIHREDKKNPESDRPNIAEILVEKHRNGPVGKIDLYFDEKRSTFQSVDKSGYDSFESF
jgi:replicative DNA helicase